MAIGETGKGVDGSYEAVTTASRAAFDRAAAVMPGGSKGAYFYSPYPLFFERGAGDEVAVGTAARVPIDNG